MENFDLDKTIVISEIQLWDCFKSFCDFNCEQWNAHEVEKNFEHLRGFINDKSTLIVNPRELLNLLNPKE